MSASKKQRQEPDEALFEEPDYDKFTDEQLDALYRGESVDSVKKQKAADKKVTTTIDVMGDAANDDVEPEEIDPVLERELRAEMDDSFSDDGDWESLDDEEFDDL